jgi:hypothetical protein
MEHVMDWYMIAVAAAAFAAGMLTQGLLLRPYRRLGKLQDRILQWERWAEQQRMLDDQQRRLRGR